MDSKVRIRIGQTEVEYEGSETFIKEELMNFVKTVIELSRITSMQLGSMDSQKGAPNAQLEMTTASMAAKLSCSSGPDLLLAAAANLTLAQKKETFSRQELLSEMKGATGYYKNSYLGNLTTNLVSQLKAGTLNELSSGRYALSAETLKDLQIRLC